jgi:adenylate cyclase
LDTSLAEAHAAKARILAEHGRYDEALAAHEISLRLEPDSFDVRYNFARTCFRLGRHEAAIEHYERAAQLLETDYVPLGLAAMSYEALGRHEECISATRRSLERVEREIAVHPDNANALVTGVNALARLGEKDRAKQWALRAQAIEPDDPQARYNLACALAQMNEPDWPRPRPSRPPRHYEFTSVWADFRFCAGFRTPAITSPSTRACGRRSKSAKARNRGGR